jgi:hypothetical protein
MMDDYETLNVTSCQNCPLMNDEHQYCMHPRPLPMAPDYTCLTPEEANGEDQPPSWCPLRKAALVIDLKQNGG